MWHRIKSLGLLVIIFAQKMVDISYRLIVGIPTIKRSQITAHVYLGGQYKLRGLQKLKQMGITAIVNMRETSLYQRLHYENMGYLHLPTVDNTPPRLEDLRKGADFIDSEVKKGGKVYIHCRQGLGRGPSMVIAYLMKIGTTYEDAFRLVKSVRPFIQPRISQINQLKELEKVYQSSNTTQKEGT